MQSVFAGCQTDGTHCVGCLRSSESPYRTADSSSSYSYVHPPELTYSGGYGSSDYSGSTTMYGYGTDYAYDNPSSVSSHGSASTRTPQRLPMHRRTPSNVSNASSTNTSGSNVNPTFQLGDETSYTPTHYVRRQVIEYEYGTGFSRQNSQDSTTLERPTTLETSGEFIQGALTNIGDIVSFGLGHTKLRSSLKRSGQSHSGGNTPTNPTPPDSLTSDDSSYMSAKDNTSVSRVRFSPTTLIDMPVPGQQLDPMIPLQARRNRPRPSLADMEREFMS